MSSLNTPSAAAQPTEHSAYSHAPMLDELDLLAVSRAFLLEEFGPMRLSHAALNRLAVAVSRRLEAQGFDAAKLLGL
jgi:hypothetical protein